MDLEQVLRALTKKKLERAPRRSLGCRGQNVQCLDAGFPRPKHIGLWKNAPMHVYECVGTPNSRFMCWDTRSVLLELNFK